MYLYVSVCDIHTVHMYRNRSNLFSEYEKDNLEDVHAPLRLLRVATKKQE